MTQASTAGRSVESNDARSGAQRPYQLALALLYLRRRALLPLAVLAGVLGASYLALQSQAPWFVATTTVWVDPKADDALQQADGLLSRYFLQRLGDSEVLQRAAAATRTSPEELARDLSVSAIRGTNLLGVSIQSSDATRAATLANAVAAAGVEQQREDVLSRTASDREARAGELARREAALTAAMQSLTLQQTAAGIAGGQLAVEQARSAATKAYDDLRDFDARREQQASALSVLAHAQVPADPAGPSLSKHLAAGMLVGGVLAVVVAMLVERFAPVLWTPAALRRSAVCGAAIGIVRGAPARAGDTSSPTAAANVILARVSALTRELQEVLVVPLAAADAPAAAWVAEQLGLASTRPQRVVVVSTARPALGPTEAAELQLALAPSVLSSPLAGSLAPRVGGVVLVGRAGHTRPSDLRAAEIALGRTDAVGALVIGGR